ncbi:arsenate reductase ArsC [bacterium]|nr:arsenate reductase ArsC [bacterium]
MPDLTVLFLCTGNSCRSQIAEGFGRKLLREGTVVLSAGTKPQGVNPNAVAIMKDAGVDISQQRSKHLSEIPRSVDLVITLCESAAAECPSGAFPHAQREHWPIDDPASARGSPEEVREAFGKCRDEIERRVAALARQIFGQTFRTRRPFLGNDP